MLNRSIQQNELLAAAQELLEAGLRTTLVQSITGIYTRKLREARKLVNATDRPTRTATNVYSYLERSFNPQSPIYLSPFVLVFLELEKHSMKHPAMILLTTWKNRKFLIEGTDSIDINAAWYAIQGTKAKEVLWARCNHCSASFIWTSKSSKAPNCPYCSCNNVKAIEP